MNRLRAYLIAFALDVLPIILGALVLYSIGTLVFTQVAYGYTGTARLVDERDVDYRTKVCVYERLGRVYLLQIHKLKFCPLTLEVEVD